MVTKSATAQTPKGTAALYAPGPSEEYEAQCLAHHDGDATDRAEKSPSALRWMRTNASTAANCADRTGVTLARAIAGTSRIPNN